MAIRFSAEIKIERSILKTQTNHQTSVGESQTNVEECRRVQTSYQTSLDKCRRVTGRVQTSVDESLGEYRQMQMSVDESIFFTFIPEKSDTWFHFIVVAIILQQTSSVCKFSILQFYLRLLLLAMFPLLTLAKPIYQLFHLMYVNLNLELMLKRARFSYT